MKCHVSQKVYNINLNKTYAVYSTGSHCNLAVYVITIKVLYKFTWYVVYKLTW